MSEERRLRGKPERRECEELKEMGWKGWVERERLAQRKLTHRYRVWKLMGENLEE